MVDDIIVWWLSDGVFDVMPNASNTSRVEEAIGGADTTDTRCVIAVQGPHARTRLATIAPEAAAVPRFGVTPFVWEGVACVAAGTGYTGEDGVECAVPVDAADALWTALLGAGVLPAGLGARDTLRLEAGLPLHGHELGPGITPLQAGLGWVVGWDKDEFRGRAALWPSGSAGSTGGWSVWPPSAANPRERGRRWSGTGDRRAPSPAGTSRPCSATGSPWVSSTRAWIRSRRWPSTSSNEDARFLPRW